MSNSPVQASIVSKIAPANYFPKRIHGLEEHVQSLALGTLVGICTKFVERSDPTGQVFVGYGGRFEYTDHDPKRGAVKSGVLFMPAGIDDMMKEVCNEAFSADAKGPTVEVRLAFEVSVIRAKNPNGYAWKFEPLMKPEQADPLEELKALTTGRNSPALAHISDEAIAAAEARQNAEDAEVIEDAPVLEGKVEGGKPRGK